MKSAYYLKKPADYRLVYREGIPKTDYLLVLKTRLNGQKITKIGIVVGKKIGGAVVRNKVKRRLRSIVSSLILKEGNDIVLITRPPIAHADYTQISDSVSKLLLRAELIDRE